MRASLIRYIFSEPRVYGSIYGLSLSLFLISIMHPYVRFEGFKKSKMLLNLLAAKPDRIEITNTGSMILLFSGHVLKVPLCEYARITLYQDHLNFKALQSSMKRKLFQYEFKENFLCGFSYYEMARLEKVEALDVEMVDYLLIALKGEKIFTNKN